MDLKFEDVLPKQLDRLDPLMDPIDGPQTPSSTVQPCPILNENQDAWSFDIIPFLGVFWSIDSLLEIFYFKTHLGGKYSKQMTPQKNITSPPWSHLKAWLCEFSGSQSRNYHPWGMAIGFLQHRGIRQPNHTDTWAMKINHFPLYWLVGRDPYNGVL